MNKQKHEFHLGKTLRVGLLGILAGVILIFGASCTKKGEDPMDNGTVADSNVGSVTSAPTEAATDTPGTTAPGTTAPGTTAPGTTAPGTMIPGTMPGTTPDTNAESTTDTTADTSDTSADTSAARQHRYNHNGK